MSQNLGPTSDISSVGLLNEIGTPLPLWTSLNDNDESTFLKPISGISHAEAKFRTNIATFGRGNVTSVAAFLTIDTTEVYSVTVTLLDNNSIAIATATIESDDTFDFALTFDNDNAASFDLSNIFIFFSIDTVSQSNLNDIVGITFFSILVTTEGGGVRQSGKCAPCQQLVPCDGLSGTHRLYFHDLSGSGVDTTGDCSAPVLQDSHFEYYGEHLIHKSNSLDFGVASVDLGMRHILTYDDNLVQLNGLSVCGINIPQNSITLFALITNAVGLSVITTNNVLPPIFSLGFGPPQEQPQCTQLKSITSVGPLPFILSEERFVELQDDQSLVGFHTTNKASRDREYHINSIDRDDNLYNIQQNFNDIYIDFLHTDNSGNMTYFDGHHLYDHYVYSLCWLNDLNPLEPISIIPEVSGDIFGVPTNLGTPLGYGRGADSDPCVSGDYLREEFITNFTTRLINNCKYHDLICAPAPFDPCPFVDDLYPLVVDNEIIPHGFIGGIHTYHDHRITFALSAKAQLWTAPQSGRHHDDTGGYNKTGGVGLFFRNDLGSGIAFMPINNLPLSSGLIGFVDNANNFTPLDLEISGDSSLVFRDSDELTMGISEQTLYRVIRPILSVDRVHDGKSRSKPSNELTGGQWDGDPNFATSGTFVEIVRGNYSLSVSMLGHCFHEGETASFIIPSGLFSTENPPTDVGVCGFGGFQAKDLCVNFSHIKDHLIPYHNHMVRSAQLCDSAGRPDFSSISERIIIPPDDPSLYDFKGCFND